MAYDLKATLKMTDEFTGPMRNILRLFDDVERQMRQVDDLWRNVERGANQAATQVNAFNTQTSNSVTQMNNLETQLQQATTQANHLSNAGSTAGGNLGAAGTAGVNAGNSITDSFKKAAAVIGAVVALDQVKDMLVGTTAGFIEFDDAVRKAGAIAGATETQFNALKDSSIELGSSTSKNATEVASAYAELAAKGFTVEQSIAAMPGIISASEASAEDLALASDTVSSALNIWGIEAEKSGHVADVLSQSANQSAAGIGDLAYAFKYAGSPAAALGIGLEEVAAAAGIMTDAGLDGSNAGTSLRASLLALLDPAKAQQKIMDGLGFSMKDSSDEAKSLSQIVGDLSEATKDMSEADRVATVSKLVGTEAVSGFLTLMDAGPEKIDKMTASLVESDGAAKKTADQMMGGIGGAVEQLGGTIDSFALTVGDSFEEPVKNMAVWLADVDTQEITAGIQSFVDYLVTTFSPLVGEVIEDVGEFKNSFMASAESGSLFYAMQDLQTGMQWVADNWEGVKDGVFALTGAFVAYRGAVAGMAIFALINGLMASYAVVAGTTTVAQWALNTAMAANPLSLVALAIAGVVAVGILLWRNWDTVKEKTIQVFEIFGGFPGIAKTVFFPIMTLVDAGKAFVDQWDSSATIWENIWGGIRAAAESSINSIIDNINKLINTINLIPGINIPIIPKVDWTPLAPVTSGGINGKGTGYGMGMGVQGYATGLESVPYDNMPALLHKNEAVLTASQSNLLRGMGVLKSSGDKPVLNATALTGRRTGTGVNLPREATRKPAIVFQGGIHINGANKSTKEIVREMVDELKYVISAGALEGETS